MKTKQTLRKSSAIGTIAATLMAISAQTIAADENQPIWAGHFKEVYSLASPQSASSSFRSNTSSIEDRLIWAGHFEQAYGPSSQGTRVVTRPDGGKYLLWAGHFKEAYQPAREEVVVEPSSIAVVMDQQ